MKGASKLAGLLGIPPLIIGLTIVAYGTSAPELAVSLQSTLGGQSDIAVGNVIGSNVFNVLMILGISALGGSSAGRSAVDPARCADHDWYFRADAFLFPGPVYCSPLTGLF